LSARQRWTPAKRKYAIFYSFSSIKTKTQARRLKCVYGSDTVSQSRAIRRFRFGNFDVKDAPRSGRPIIEKGDKIMEIVESDRHVSTVSIAQKVNIAKNRLELLK